MHVNFELAPYVGASRLRVNSLDLPALTSVRGVRHSVDPDRTLMNDDVWNLVGRWLPDRDLTKYELVSVF